MAKAILNPKLELQIEKLMDKSDEYWADGRYVECIELMEKSWDKLPEPKESYSESYHIVMEISGVYLLMGKYDKAKEWSDKIFQCALHRIDSGEREFLAGRVAFESGDRDKAKEFFEIANAKSEGRCFEEEDAKYYKFFKEEMKKAKKPYRGKLVPKDFTHYNFRNGSFAIHNGKEYQLFCLGMNNYRLISKDSQDIANGFERKDGVYKKTVGKEAISAAYNLKTTLTYRKQKFGFTYQKEDQILLEATNFDYKIARELQLEKTSPGKYQKWISKVEIEDVQEQFKTVEDFPMPENINELKHE